MPTGRGVFIVFEGCDKSGKSTQCRKLSEVFNELDIPNKIFTFPNRITPTGILINNYLKGETQLDNHVIHLLFTANRWEFQKEIEESLMNGISVIADRYSYSGVAYSAMKEDMDLEWCRNPEIGLPKPDAVFLLKAKEKLQINRADYGTEVYEVPHVQRAVAEMFEKMKDESWFTMSTNGTIAEVHEKILELALSVKSAIKNQPIKKLW